MSRAAEYARRVRRLYHTLLRRSGKPRIHAPRDPADELLLALLLRHASDSRASAALARLRQATVDLNDLRVTPAAEIANLLGGGFPMARETGESIARVLNAVFNRKHTVDLSFLANLNRKDARAYLTGLDGLDPHAAALVLLRCFRVPLVPLDPLMLEYLRANQLIDPGLSHAEAQAFLGRVFPLAQAEPFYHLLKRHAAAHPPRRSAPPPEAVPAAADPAPAAAPTLKPPPPHRPVRSKKKRRAAKPKAAKRPSRSRRRSRPSPVRQRNRHAQRTARAPKRRTKKKRLRPFR